MKLFGKKLTRKKREKTLKQSRTDKGKKRKTEGKPKDRKTGKEKKKRGLGFWFLLLVLLGAFGLCAALGLNAYVKGSSEEYILTSSEAGELENIDCILVLGCGVRPDGTPSDMLKDRIERGIELYTLGVAPKLLMSGDHGQVEYDEVNTMKDYAIGEGIPSEDIFMDHAGFSTYETMYRSRDVFCVSRAVVVTQRYHEYRALYIGKKLGLDVTGVYARDVRYTGQSYRDFREVLARCKDYFQCIFWPKPTYLGEPFDITGDGRDTWS
jgi:vancomycin permeability regulator SanA